MKLFLFLFVFFSFTLHAQEYSRKTVKTVSGRAHLKSNGKPVTGKVFDYFLGTQVVRGETNYVNGFKHGKFFIYDSLGFPIRIWTYLNGKKHDTTFIFYDNHQLKKVEVYENHKLINQKGYPADNPASKGGLIYFDGEIKGSIHIMRFKSEEGAIMYGISKFRGGKLQSCQQDGDVEVISFLIESINGQSESSLIGIRHPGNVLPESLRDEIIVGAVKWLKLKSIRVKNSDGYTWEIPAKVIKFNTQVG